MLVIVTASSRSNDSVPSPSQNGRYEPAKGITASMRRIGAKVSSTEVRMWMARKTIASSDTDW